MTTGDGSSARHGGKLAGIRSSAGLAVDPASSAPGAGPALRPMLDRQGDAGGTERGPTISAEERDALYSQAMDLLSGIGSRDDRIDPRLSDDLHLLLDILGDIGPGAEVELSLPTDDLRRVIRGIRDRLPGDVESPRRSQRTRIVVRACDRLLDRLGTGLDLDDRGLLILAKVLGHPLRLAILRDLRRDADACSPTTWAFSTGEALGNVAYHFRLLERLGVLSLARTERRRGAMEHFYELRGPLCEAVLAVLDLLQGRAGTFAPDILPDQDSRAEEPTH